MKDLYLTNNFIQRAKDIHKDKPYDYSKVSCTKFSDKVTITCKIHGDFTQVAYYHITGRGCRSCGNSLSQEDFISRISEYNLQLLSPYLGIREKVIFFCLEHKEQEDIAENLLHGGCNFCKYPYRTITGFLKYSNKIFGINKSFIYNKLKEPILAKDKIEVYCLNCKTTSYPTVKNHFNSKSSCNKCWGGSRNMREKINV